MAVHKRTLVIAGVLIAFIAGAFAATALVARPSASALPVTQIFTPAAASSQNTLTVVGVGTASATPDQAVLSLGVQASRSNVHEAVTVAVAEMTRLLSAIHSQGIQDKDLQTASVSIYSQTNCCPQGVTTYVASNQVNVKLHLAAVTAVIESAVDAVGNDLQLNGVTLLVGDNTAQVKTARANAMADANARAQQWASLANHRVGQIVGMSEIVSVQPSNICDGCGKGGGGGAAVQILPGVSTMTITITVVYELV
jgi:uncharacterized protein YggE